MITFIYKKLARQLLMKAYLVIPTKKKLEHAQIAIVTAIASIGGRKVRAI